MESSKDILLLADVLLVVHVLFAAFVVLGMLLILIGKFAGWHWIRNPWFRLLHMVSIAFVVIQSWLGFICPLTTLEMALRSRASDTVYAGSFISYWLGKVLYYPLPSWVFILCYTLFGAVVVASWFWIRPRRFY